ncbi:uncharacterized protein PADG_01169 [Paracoccidioides brasiliensis Pb18]|uniref:DUF3074 domain-containing protein n=2 Tax=Paracoccidioides brasiliensis TaxID=121759 RepID=C1FZE3_PARBD|nr:uncharacterized protein PADG_01169 [Paracoccidioides brasiliensis Pb18]EEH44880.1 hypothetical protein PADG_01169 [Paracoccidioides brasiliensis Pb18]ODH39285.1 hypothetical protein ACO22_01953 [Paracoccidioides brasiliensis]ODH49115.1 hypothetical protein GX48_04733 [Paracoccidioides brasiliensis]
MPPPAKQPSLIRPIPLSPSAIPAHPSIALPLSSNDGTTRSHPSLSEFIHTTLTQAYTFITDTVPGKTFTADPKLRHALHSTAEVKLFSGATQSTSRSSKKDDKWFARRSVHQNCAVKGTASYEEFVHALKDNHFENESQYVQSLKSAETIAEWDCSGLDIEGGWSGVTACVKVSIHTFEPTSLFFNRAFPIIYISAFLPAKLPAEPTGYINVHLPIQPAAIPVFSLPENTILSNYAAVELVQTIAQSTQVEWTMATNSSAGGWIPAFVQHSWTLGGIPRAIVRNVGLFMQWVDGRRGMKPTAGEDTGAE